MLTEKYIADMTDGEMRNILLREEIVAELRGVIERYPKSSISNLRTAVLHRTAPELGVSKAEVAKGFCPERLDKNYYAGCYLARLLISRMKRGLKKMKVDFRAAKVPVPLLGCGERWLYYNMQSRYDPNFVAVELHKRRIIDGFDKMRRRENEVLRMDPDERRRLADAFEAKQLKSYIRHDSSGYAERRLAQEIRKKDDITNMKTCDCGHGKIFHKRRKGCKILIVTASHFVKCPCEKY
jgi:hypothetical protein